MVFDPQRHHRRSIRHLSYDYREDGAYFVTLCTRGRLFAFGNIVDDQLQPTQRGLIARSCWDDIPKHRPYVTLDEFVVMPNHVHGVLWIEGGRATQVSPLRGDLPRLIPASLGAIVGAYKAAVSREINKLRQDAARGLWQPNYYEHVIRTEQALGAIREYVLTNPQRWASDHENPTGNQADELHAFLRTVNVTGAPRRCDADAGRPRA